MDVIGYFTIESTIVGLNTRQIEMKLGFQEGRLARGASILVLDKEPKPDQYTPAGSTFFPGTKGLNTEELKRTQFRPGAWVGQRLVKVVADLAYDARGEDPRGTPMAAEQWILTDYVSAHEVWRLKAGDTYWG